jgi:hypothetical protein
VGGSDETRGVADRGTGPRAERERNVRRGEVHPVVPGRTYNVVGFDIGKANLAKPGFEAELEPVVERLRALVGRSPDHPVVRITGHASDSIHPGRGPAVYAGERADAVKAYLVSRGVPSGWIETTTSREGPRRVGPPGGGTARSKAAARAATIEILKPPDHRGTADRFADGGGYVVGRKQGWERPDWHLPRLPDWKLPDWHMPRWPEIPKKVWNKYWETVGKAYRYEKKEVTDMAAGGAIALGGLIFFSLEEILTVGEAVFGRPIGPDAKQYIQKTLVEELEQHHDLVQKLIDWYAHAGINAHHYTKYLPESFHRWLHPRWERAWQVFFELHLTHGRPPTAEEITDFLMQMLEAWATERLPHEDFRWADVPLSKKKKK